MGQAISVLCCSRNPGEYLRASNKYMDMTTGLYSCALGKCRTILTVPRIIDQEKLWRNRMKYKSTVNIKLFTTLYLQPI